MASVSKRGKKWLVRWRERDGEAWIERNRTTPDRETALELKRRVERTVALGERFSADTDVALPLLAAQQEDGTLIGVFPDFLAVQRVGKAVETVRQYNIALMDYAEFLARSSGRTRLTLDLVTDESIVAWWNDMGARELALSTKRCRVFYVQRALRWAERSAKYRETAPVLAPLEMPTVPHRHIRAPSWLEMDAFIHAADGAYERPDSRNRNRSIGERTANQIWRRRLGIVMRFTGLRVNQVMRLRWDDVDMDAATLRIQGQLGKSKQEKAGRIIPISPHLVAELAGWGRRESWLVAPHKKSRVALAVHSRAVWERTRVPLEIWSREPKGDPHHCFRKGFRSNLKKAGADRDSVEFLIGHAMPGSDPSYQDPDFLPLREAAALVPPLNPESAIRHLLVACDLGVISDQRTAINSRR